MWLATYKNIVARKKKRTKRKRFLSTPEGGVTLYLAEHCPRLRLRYYHFSVRHNRNLFKSQSNTLIYRGENFGHKGTIGIFNCQITLSGVFSSQTVHMVHYVAGDGEVPSLQDSRFIINLNCTIVSVALQ